MEAPCVVGPPDIFFPMTLPALPVHYYLDHFTEMLAFVESTCASDLTVGRRH
jgi:hypothetical protein